ncbi:hypothetical protein P7C73_g6205, partial [Tremellales sp. Uapishka_1]
SPSSLPPPPTPFILRSSLFPIMPRALNSVHSSTTTDYPADEALRPEPAPPLSLQPLLDAADTPALQLFVNSYIKLIEKARYGKREPTEEDASACDKLLEIVLVTLDIKRNRGSGVERMPQAATSPNTPKLQLA